MILPDHLGCSFTFLKYRTEDDSAVLRIIFRHYSLVFLKCAALKLEASSCWVESFSLCFHIQQGDHSVLHWAAAAAHP